MYLNKNKQLYKTGIQEIPFI